MTNYKKGRRFEYEICKQLASNSIFTTRTAGSHSPVDVISISQNKIRLIQAKTSINNTLNNLNNKNKELNLTNLTKYDSDILKLKKIPERVIVNKELWVKEFRKPILKFKITKNSIHKIT